MYCTALPTTVYLSTGSQIFAVFLSHVYAALPLCYSYMLYIYLSCPSAIPNPSVPQTTAPPCYRERLTCPECSTSRSEEGMTAPRIRGRERRANKSTSYSSRGKASATHEDSVVVTPLVDWQHQIKSQQRGTRRDTRENARNLPSTAAHITTQ